jgi:hypothetical protein
MSNILISIIIIIIILAALKLLSLLYRSRFTRHLRHSLIFVLLFLRLAHTPLIQARCPPATPHSGLKLA